MKNANLSKEELIDRYFKSFHDEDMETGDLSADELVLYRQVVSEMADKKNPKAMHLLAYDCYGGNEAFPCDWFKSRDLLLELMQTDSEHKGLYANTLGYIYYYGRCNNGVRQYDEAFKYFTLGEAHGYYESTYKLADMYLNGYGVPKDYEAAFRLVHRYFDDNFSLYAKGDNRNTLADIALRLGSMTFNGKSGHDENADGAYWYYLLADKAIRDRMKESHFFGNQKVFDSIQEGLRKCRELLNPKLANTVRIETPTGIFAALAGNNIIEVKIKELKDSTRFTTRRVPLGRDGVERIMICSPQDDYLEFFDKVCDYATHVKRIKVTGDFDTFLANDCYYDARTAEWVFTFLGNVTARIFCKNFVYKFKRPQE